MTDNEIIKALECCTQQVGCKGCPLVISNEMKYHGGYACAEKLRKSSLDLINRQKAEIEKLERIEAIGTKTIETQNAEIERLQNERIERIRELTRVVYDKEIAKAKVEAIKEFAERVKGECEGGWLEIEESVFDNLVKEMVGESNV